MEDERRGEKKNIIQIAIILRSIIHKKYCQHRKRARTSRFYALFIAMERYQNIDLIRIGKRNVLTRK